MKNGSVTYRKAAEAWREAAKTSSIPAEWLGFAAEWEKMAALDDQLFVQVVRPEATNLLTNMNDHYEEWVSSLLRQPS